MGGGGLRANTCCFKGFGVSGLRVFGVLGFRLLVCGPEILTIMILSWERPYQVASGVFKHTEILLNPLNPLSPQSPQSPLNPKP